MKILILITALLSTVQLSANIGTDPLGGKVLNHPTYPSSGSTRSRGNLTGGDNASASRFSNREGTNVPERDPRGTRQEQESREDAEIQPGPYNLRGEYQFWTPKE